jgi:acetyl esterase/lipase
MRRYFTVAATCAPLVFFNMPAVAQTMPPDIAEKIEAAGRIIDGRGMNALYAPLHDKEPYANIKINRDLKYGAAERNALDVFTPEPAGAPKPVLIFVHAGGLERGAKSTPGTPFMDNIGVWAVRNGIVGVNINYRLVPEAKWPSGPEDAAAALAWVKANIVGYGGDPARIYMMGWSAGGNVVASYVAFPQFHNSGNSGLAGAILLSPDPIDPAVADMKRDSYKHYFGDDPSILAERLPLVGLTKTSVPLMVAYAGFDPPAIAQQSTDLIAALCKRTQGCASSLLLKTHNHMSEGNSIGTKDTELTDQILAFMKVGKPTN